MKIKLAPTLYVIGALLAPIAAHAAEGDSDRSHPLTFVKDSAITTKVKAKLADEKMSSLVHVSVDTDNKGVVQLSGKVKSQDDLDKAISITRSTEGVTAVRSNLVVSKED